MPAPALPCEALDPTANRAVLCQWCGVGLTWWDGKEECRACGPPQEPCEWCGHYCPARHENA